MTKHIILLALAIFLGILSLFWLFEATSTYITGVSAQSYGHTFAKVSTVAEHFNPIGVSRTASLKYEVKGKTYTSEQALPNGVIVRPGETVDVYYNGLAPCCAVMKQEIDYDTVIIKGAFGLLFFSISALMLSRLTRRSFLPQNCAATAETK